MINVGSVRSSSIVFSIYHTYTVVSDEAEQEKERRKERKKKGRKKERNASLLFAFFLSSFFLFGHGKRSSALNNTHTYSIWIDPSSFRNGKLIAQKAIV